MCSMKTVLPLHRAATVLASGGWRADIPTP